MSARTQRTVPRDPASAADRERILAAARAVLAEERSSTAFTLDAIAARAGVARAVMQRQFGLLSGVCEALWDELAASCLRELPRAYALHDPTAALDELIAIFVRFWSAERRVLRRLRALAALDSELERALLEREQERRMGLRKLAGRFALRPVQLSAAAATATALRGAARFDTLDVVAIATSFESYEAIAGSTHEPAEVSAALRAIAHAALAVRSQ